MFQSYIRKDFLKNKDSLFFDFWHYRMLKNIFYSLVCPKTEIGRVNN